MAEYATILCELAGPVLHCTLNRPEVRNALNLQMLEELKDCFSTVVPVCVARIVILRGSGGFFCSGADLNWMRESATLTPEQNLAEARTLSETFSAIESSDAFLLGVVEGGAFGGGLGLIACCDSVIAAGDCHFAFSEVRFGLSPATIAPSVLRRTGLSEALDLMLSARRFDAQRAYSAGLVQQVVDAEAIDESVAREVAQILQCAPQALAATKRLLHRLAGSLEPEMAEVTARLIAELRRSAEGQEGLNAFAEKRKPAWDL